MIRGAVIGLALIVATAPVHADDKADAYFRKGKKLLAEKKYADACAAFEKSNELDPGIGAKLNIAKCYEDWGKLASALKWYRDAEKQATDTKDNRVAKIHERRQAVDDDTPRLTLRVAADADAEAANVLLDGQPAKVGEPLEVDPGAHLVEYTNEAGERKKKVVPVERGSASDVKLDLPKKKPGGGKHIDKHVDKHVDKPDDKHVEPDKHDTKPPPPEDPGKQQKLFSLIGGGVGVVMVGVSSYLTLDARSDYKAALSAHCGGVTSNCDSDGLSITHHARSEANWATVVGLVGLLAIGGGTYFYLTAPHAAATSTSEHAFYVAPAIDGNGAGVVFGGSY